MTDLDLTVRLKADNTGLVGEVRVSREEIDRLGREIGQSGQQARSAATGVDRYAREVDHAGRQARELTDRNRRLAQGYGQLRAAIAAVGIAVLSREYIQAADTATLLHSRLKLVTDGEEDLIATERELFQVAQDTRSAYEATVTLYTRVARSTEELGVSQQELLRFTTATNQAIQVGGNTATEAAAGVIQLGQALASGELRGEELRSVMEQMPRLSRAIADGLGVTIGELRALAEAGELTSERIFDAVISQADQLQSEFDQLERTVGGAMQQLRNDLLLAVTAADDMGGATEVLVETIDDMREIVRDPEFQAGLAAIASFLANGIGFAVRNADTIALLAAAYGTAKVATVAWTGAQVALNIALRANPIGLLLTGVGLLATGLYALTTGGEEAAAAIAEYDQAMRDARQPMADFTGLSENAAVAAANESIAHLRNAAAINKEMQARILARRSEAGEQLPPGLSTTVTGLAERGYSADQILTGPDSPFGPDVPYTNQTETAVARIVELTEELRSKGQDLREVQQEIDQIVAGILAPPANNGGGVLLQTDTDAEKRLEELRQAREELEFEIAIMARSEREQEILTALRRAGTEAIVAQGQSLEAFVAGLSAEEQAIAQLTGVLFDYRAGVEAAAEAERLAAEQAEEAARAHADAVEDIGQRLLDLLPPYRQALAEAEAWRAGALAALDETAEGYEQFAADVERIYEDMLADAYEADLRNRRDWAAGVEGALRDAADAAGNDAAAFADLTTGALREAEDAWVEFAKTGKLSLSDLGEFMQDWALRYAFRKLIEPGLNEGISMLAGTAGASGGGGSGSFFGALGSLFGSGSGAPAGAPPRFYHGGGRVTAGGPAWTMPPALFASAQRYHDGGMVLKPDEVPAILKAGEFVSTPEQFNNMGSLMGSLSRIAARQAVSPEATRPLQKIAITMNVHGVTDAESFRRSEGQILSRLQGELSRAGRRQG